MNHRQTGQTRAWPLCPVPMLGALLLCGCLYPGYKKADSAICDLAAQPFDVAPVTFTAPAPEPPAKSKTSGDKPSSDPPRAAREPDTDVRTAAYLQRADTSGTGSQLVAAPAPGTAEQPDRAAPSDAESLLEKRLKMPAAIPAADTPDIVIPRNWTEKQKLEYLRRLYPELPALAEVPAALPGPNGCPLTLDDLQRLAAANSPALREAAAAVVTAEGNTFQAGVYPNPTFSISNQPNNNNATAGAYGFGWDQVVKTGGKLKLAQGAVAMDLENAKLALQRARSDLATQVRNAYFALLVNKETVRVNKGLAEFTDVVYRISEEILEKAGQVAAYEPAALRAQVYTIRLAYRQAIQNYIYSWETLRATIGLRHMPLTQVAGRLDVAIPYYDYNAVLDHVLRHHTDVKTAYNGIVKAKLNLKLSQITPLPDPDVSFNVWKESTVMPFTWFYQVTVGVPVPVWDCNKGGILAAQGSLMSAQEEPHRVELALTNTLATAYAGYKTNLQALEDYRTYILPDQIRVYRGILRRRSIDITGVAFSDLVGAQQAVAAGVAQYLTTLGALWSSVVSVADLLQTNDLFQLAHPIGVAPVPDLPPLPPLPCSHPCAHGAGPVLAPSDNKPLHALPVPPDGKPAGNPTEGPELLPPAQKVSPAPRPGAGKQEAPSPPPSAALPGGSLQPVSLPSLPEPPPLDPPQPGVNRAINWVMPSLLEPPPLGSCSADTPPGQLSASPTGR